MVLEGEVVRSKASEDSSVGSEVFLICFFIFVRSKGNRCNRAPDNLLVVWGGPSPVLGTTFLEGRNMPSS